MVARMTPVVLAVLLAGSLGTPGAAEADATVYGCAIGDEMPFIGLDPGQLQVGSDYCVFTALGTVRYAGTGTFSVRVLHARRDRHRRLVVVTTVYRGKGLVTQGTTRAVRGDTVIAHTSGPRAALTVGGNG